MALNKLFNKSWVTWLLCVLMAAAGGVNIRYQNIEMACALFALSLMNGIVSALLDVVVCILDRIEEDKANKFIDSIKATHGR